MICNFESEKNSKIRIIKFSFFCIHFLFILRIFDFEFLKNKVNRIGQGRKGKKEEEEEETNQL